MAAFLKPEHQAVATALRAMDRDLMMNHRCWFAGGTEIVLDLGEDRLSKDVSFLCADGDGYPLLLEQAVLARSNEVRRVRPRWVRP